MKADLLASAILLGSAALAASPGCPFVNHAGDNLCAAKRFTYLAFKKSTQAQVER